MILSRNEYKNYLETIIKGASNPHSGVWVPEQQYPPNKSNWFICTKPIDIYSGCFWDDCASNMQGHLKCYMSSNERQVEWWGFTEFDDAVWFLLRWVT